MKKYLLYIVISILLLNSKAFAVCNFKAKLGENLASVEEKVEIALPSINNSTTIIAHIDEVCPKEKFGMSAVEYFFIEQKLVSINLKLLNDDLNSASNSGNLMKYVKRNYGKFETGSNSSSWRGYQIWKKNGQTIVYRRYVANDGILEEDLFISTDKYIDTISNFFSEIEQQMESHDN